LSFSISISIYISIYISIVGFFVVSKKLEGNDDYDDYDDDALSTN